MRFPSISSIICAAVSLAHKEQRAKQMDTSIILATIAGPILAVQAQKIIEWMQAQTRAKDAIFKTLMATRATRLSVEHVQALNAIELAFYGTRKFPFFGTAKKEKKVLEAWRTYHDHLNKTPGKEGSEKEWVVWLDKQVDLFVALLHEMATCLGYDFDRTYIKNSWYAPEAHATVEKEMHMIRIALAEILNGHRYLPVAAYPINDEQAKENIEMRQLLMEWLKRNQNIQTVVIAEDSKPNSSSLKLPS